MAFFKALGFSHNPRMADDSGACIVVSDTVLVMLLTHARFRGFTPKDIYKPEDHGFMSGPQ